MKKKINSDNDKYIRYLYSKIKLKRGKSFLYLSRLLNTYNFFWTVRNDDNRIDDALEIRETYIEETGADPLSFDEGFVSVFEVLVAIIYRMMYLMYGEERGITTSKLFLELLRNLKIDSYSDDIFLQKRRIIEQDVRTKINKMVHRRYKKDGEGGLFPLKGLPNGKKTDLRKTELWYQMMYYMEENYP